jgi:hypothetical protein
VTVTCTMASTHRAGALAHLCSCMREHCVIRHNCASTLHIPRGWHAAAASHKQCPCQPITNNRIDGLPVKSRTARETVLQNVLPSDQQWLPKHAKKTARPSERHHCTTCTWQYSTASAKQVVISSSCTSRLKHRCTAEKGAAHCSASNQQWLHIQTHMNLHALQRKSKRTLQTDTAHMYIVCFAAHQ